MKGNVKNTAYRVAGTAGLILLLGIILWAQRQNRPYSTAGVHDHSDPLQYGHEITDQSLTAQMQELTPSGKTENGVRIVEYDAFQYHFDPDPLVVRAGEKVHLLVASRDVAHGVMIPEIGFSTDILPGERKPAEFTAPAKPGEYPVFCSVFCGSGHGEMKGRLIVLPAAQDHGHE
jgi:cytochrome c oxidase subunit 2